MSFSFTLVLLQIRAPGKSCRQPQGPSESLQDRERTFSRHKLPVAVSCASSQRDSFKGWPWPVSGAGRPARPVSRDGDRTRLAASHGPLPPASLSSGSDQPNEKIYSPTILSGVGANGSWDTACIARWAMCTVSFLAVVY